MVTLYTITLTVACCIAVALLVVGDRRARAGGASWVTTSTLAVFTACAATLSTLAYAMAGPNSDNLLPLVIGDVTMPLAVGLLVATLRRAAGRRRSLASSALVISLAVGAMTLFVSIEAGYAAKLIVLALFGFTATITCVRAGFAPLCSWLVGGTTALYAAYSLLRLVGPIVAGDDPTMQAAVGLETATIVAAIAVGAISVGVILIIRRSDAPEPSPVVSSEALTDWIGALLSQRSAFAAIATSVPDISLHRAAFGRPWAQAITEAVTRATVAAMPSGSVVGHANSDVLVAIQFGQALDLEMFRARLQEGYEHLLPRWAPTDPPDLQVETVQVTHPSDIRRYARRMRTATRRAAALQGM